MVLRGSVYLPEALVFPQVTEATKSTGQPGKKQEKTALHFKKANCETREEDMMKTGCCHMFRFPHKHFIILSYISMSAGMLENRNISVTALILNTLRQ